MTIYYLLTIDPHTEPEEIEESLSLHGIPADIRVSLSAEVGVGLDATPGQVDGDLLQVGFSEGEGQLVIVHQRAVGHVQGTRTSQRRTRWKRNTKISTVTETFIDFIFVFCVCVCFLSICLFRLTPKGQGQLVIVHQGAVGHVQGTRTSQWGARWKRYRKISITVTEWDLYRIFLCVFVCFWCVRLSGLNFLSTTKVILPTIIPWVCSLLKCIYLFIELLHISTKWNIQKYWPFSNNHCKLLEEYWLIYTVQTFNSCTSQPDVCQCLVEQPPKDNTSKNKPSIWITHIAYISKLRLVMRSSMPMGGNRGCGWVLCRAAQAFSAGIICRHRTFVVLFMSTIRKSLT